jgi:hypothetical protein
MLGRILLSATLISAALLPPATAQSQPAMLIMVDGASKVVGPVLEPGVAFSLVGMNVGGHAIAASVSRTGFEGAIATGFGVYFASTNCTGTPNIEWPIGPLTLEPQAIVGPNDDVYVAPITTAGQPFAYASRLLPNAACDIISGSVANAVPGSFVASLTPQYSPPFHVEPAPAPFLASVPAVSVAGLVVLIAVLASAGILLARCSRPAA